MPVPGLHVDAYVDDVYDWLESCSPVSLAAIKGDPHGDDYPRLRVPAFKRHDPSTWTPSNVPPNLHGIMKHYCGQLDWQWRLRELCYPPFSELYGDDDLLAAFDGFCFLRPLELSGRSGPRETADEQPAGPAVSGYKQWLHLDQDRLHELSDGHEPGVLSCAQGLVTLSESGPEDGGLVLVEKSHLAFAGYLERHALAGFGEWLLVDMEDEVLSELDVIKVCAPAGHLVLWDSRVVHANCPPRGQSTPRPRICAYVSMQPRSHASKKDLARRLAMFEGCRQTGHWVAGHALKDTGRHPYTRGAPIVMPERPFALPELSALAGDSSATNDGRRRSSLLSDPARGLRAVQRWRHLTRSVPKRPGTRAAGGRRSWRPSRQARAPRALLVARDRAAHDRLAQWVIALEERAHEQRPACLLLAEVGDACVLAVPPALDALIGEAEHLQGLRVQGTEPARDKVETRLATLLRGHVQLPAPLRGAHRLGIEHVALLVVLRELGEAHRLLRLSGLGQCTVDVRVGALHEAVVAAAVDERRPVHADVRFPFGLARSCATSNLTRSTTSPSLTIARSTLLRFAARIEIVAGRRSFFRASR